MQNLTEKPFKCCSKPCLWGAEVQVTDTVEEVVLGVPAERAKQHANVQPRKRYSCSILTSPHISHDHSLHTRDAFNVLQEGAVQTRQLAQVPRMC